MQFGIFVPNYGDCCGSCTNLGELALEAENSRWDGFFIFDHVQYSANEHVPLADPWIALATIAMRTKRIRIGPLITPLARRRPWKLARETVSIDHLSKGRLTLGVGLGDPADAEFTPLGEDADDRIRAAKLDEGLRVLAGLWSGELFSYVGKHYQVQNVQFLPRPLQSPRIPVWVAGRWPKRAPFLRAAQWDGVFPLGLARGSKLGPEEIHAIVSFVRNHRPDISTYDVIATSGAEGQVDDDEKLRAFANAGATWWLQDMRKWCNSIQELRSRIQKGPPRI